MELIKLKLLDEAATAYDAADGPRRRAGQPCLHERLQAR